MTAPEGRRATRENVRVFADYDGDVRESADVVIVGSGLSYVLDLPTGAAIVCTFGIALGTQVLIEGLVRRR